MINKFRNTMVALAGSGLMLAGSVGLADAAPDQEAGAAGLVAAIVQLQNNGEFDVVEIDNTLNNLIALNNVLNNSPILSNNDVDVNVYDVVDVQDVLNDLEIDVDINDVLNDLGIVANDVVGVAVLSGGDVIVLT